MVDDLTLGTVVNVDPVAHLTLLAGQAGDVLLDEGTDNSLVEVADEVEGVVGSVGGALLGDLEHAVIVHFLQILNMEGLAAPVVVADGRLYRVVEHGLGQQTLVLEQVLELAHRLVVTLLILTDVGKLEVSELEQGLQVLDGGLAADLIIIGAH